MRNRAVPLLALLLLSTALAGCSSQVTPPERVATESADAYTVRDTHAWTSGSTTEYRSKLVVTAELERTADGEARVPEVSVRFRLGNGEIQTVQADYEIERRLTAYEDLENQSLAPGESVAVRTVFDPADAATVENATVVVGR